MDRQVMLSIINAMGDDQLTQALSSVGVQVDGGMEDMGDESAEGLEGWNAKQVTMGDPQKPQFLDKSKFAPPAPQPQARPQYYNQTQDMAGLEQYMPQPEMMGGQQ